MRRGLFVAVHIADLHFGAFNPQEQFQILKDQFLSVLDTLPRIDLISIDGDIYDHKLMGNSDGLYYASLFIDEIVRISKIHHCTVILIHGTYSHDADQLKNFYHYMNDNQIDVRVVTQIQFENIKNTRVLCIPELYGIDESIYQRYLHYSGYYDEAYMHGTFQGSVYGNNVGNGRLFTPVDFDMCKGFMIGGHVHTPGCFFGYFYYTGSPYRWKFGEEEDKGFLITVHDLDTHQHYVHFQKIISKSYITIDLEQLQNTNPKDLIEYINRLKKERGIDYLKVRVKQPISGSDKVIINNYYRNSPYTSVEFTSVEEDMLQKKEKDAQLDENLSFLLDNRLSEIDKFIQFVNFNEGCEFITVDQFMDILNEQI